MSPQSFKFCSGEIIYHPHFLSPSQANALFNDLKHQINWQSDQIRIMGKEHMIPRLHSWIADPEISYKYSGINLKINPWTESLLNLKMKCEKASNWKFNSMLANYYRDGSDSNGWHADNEKELGNKPLIAMLSFGQVRRFSIRDKQDHKNKLDFDLENGSLFIMRAPLQHTTQHCLRKTKKPCAPRISLTFRLTHPQ
ncbi:alpha-ketoglutarate-dependent dioxygenase AlkB [Lentisphaera marina]|uniref:alpha-ketoglutarate-dependent dioxygenase AlkB family protein n=1 Tax=Lentisphaera marina TaxID=1111041 RepID=UPI0023673F7F|nr:alpha-ketoglutarate-dependent dioxygenase AlkB [Lentisphaera marina]MDD7984212.1 alpha-ketoglutarate-dependent dioxygenase AlkB [Lentisphaera marina]